MSALGRLRPERVESGHSKDDIAGFGGLDVTALVGTEFREHRESRPVINAKREAQVFVVNGYNRPIQ